MQVVENCPPEIPARFERVEVLCQWGCEIEFADGVETRVGPELCKHFRIVVAKRADVQLASPARTAVHCRAFEENGGLEFGGFLRSGRFAREGGG